METSGIKANSVDPDQGPRSAASDLHLHCLPVTLFGVSRLNWVNVLMEQSNRRHSIMSLERCCNDNG